MPFSDKQIEFITKPLSDIEIMSGVTGSGKSFAANLKLYEEIVSDVQPYTHIFSGNTSESLYDNVVTPFLQIDEGIGDFEYKTVVNKPRLICKRNKSEVVLVGANNEGAEARIQGKPKVKTWYADEVVKQPKSFVQQCLSRLRFEHKGKLVTGKAIWTCNPDHPNHYVKRDYIDKENDKHLGVHNTYWGFYDNPLMTDDFINKAKARYTGAFLERMIYGKWVAAEGCVFDKFDKSRHIVDSYNKRHVAEYYIGIDWGYENPLAMGLWAKDYDGCYILIDELYLKHQQIDDSLFKILKQRGWLQIEHEAKTFRPMYAIADSNRPEYITLFTQKSGIPCIPANKDVVEGIHTVNVFFANDRIKSVSACHNWIREVENYQWAKGRGDTTKDEPLKIDDHHPDQTRYVLHTLEAGRVRQLPKNPFGK